MIGVEYLKAYRLQILRGRWAPIGVAVGVAAPT